MRVDNEADLREQLVSRGVNALFARGLAFALPLHRSELDAGDILRCRLEIVKAARGYEKVLLVKAAAYIAPCSCDKSGFQKLPARVAYKRSCNAFFHAHALLN